MNAPSSTVLTQWAKGAPNGLVDPNRKGTIQIRNYNVTPQLPTNGLTVTELFCGGGLMAVGLKAAGYDIIFANDFDKNAVKAYAHNLGDYVVCGDITDEAIQAQIPDADIIAGGPPCQDYSVAGTGEGEEGERGKLVWSYLGVVARKQPKAFVFENVKGLITKRHRATFDALLAHFDSINYNVSWRVVNAWDYGVAQKRERVIAVGIRKDLGFTFEFPEPTAEEYRTQVLRDVIGDLPEPNSGVNAHIQTQATTVKRTEGVYNQRSYKADWDTPAKMVCTNRLDHAEIHPGPDNHDKLNPRDGGFSSQYLSRDRVVKWDNPAHTVLTNPRDVSIHPGDGSVTMDQIRAESATKEQATHWKRVAGAPRRFTVRECLRIQSVPDWYVLPDSISLSAQYRIVGNGVASRVSYKIGVALADQLNAAIGALATTERRAA